MSEKNELFENTPVRKAVLSLAVPTIISQLITVVYNMADTFYIGQLNDPRQVAAATVAMPVFMILTAIANLFGTGGSSLISRSLGIGDLKKAKSASSFCIWTGILLSFAYGVFLCVARPFILPMLEATKDIYEYTYSYVFYTIVIGAVPTVLNFLLSHLIRSEGHSAQASFGIAFGGILNMVLDPVLIFVFKMNIIGAAIATLISNVISSAYFIIFILRKKNKTVITFNPKYYSVSKSVPTDVIAIGLPSAVISLMATVSNSALNCLISAHSAAAIAGMGIAKKMNMLAFAFSQGTSQGALPLIGFNYASGNKKRMMDSIKITFFYGLAVSICIAALLYIFAPKIAFVFIHDPETIEYAKTFLKIICLVGPTTMVSFTVITIFQAVGEKLIPLILSTLRKGVLDIPLMFIFNGIIGINGVAWATPAADFIAFAVAVSALIYYINKKILK